MPCFVTGSEAGDARLLAEEAQKEALEATNVACEAAELLREHGLLQRLSDASLGWVDRHDKIDRKRLEKQRERERREQLRGDALRKLTAEEREALGL